MQTNNGYGNNGVQVHQEPGLRGCWCGLVISRDVAVNDEAGVAERSRGGGEGLSGS